MVSASGSFVGVVLVVVGLVASAYGWKRYRIYQLVAGTPTTEARSVVDEGLVELTGEAVAREPMDSPIRGAECVLAGWLAEEWDQSGKHSSWTSIATGIEAVPFGLDDGTGQVRVEVPSRASGSDLLASVSDLLASEGVALEGIVCEFERFDPSVEVGVDETPPEHLRNFVARSSALSAAEGKLLQFLDFGNQHGDRRYTESVVRPGEELYLLGYARRTDRGSGADDEWGSDSDRTVWTVGPPPAGEDGLLVLSTRRKSALIDAARRRAAALPLGVLATVVGVAILLGRVPL